MIRSRKWMALVAGTVTAAGVIALTGLLSVRDRTYVRQQLRSEAERTRDLVEAKVEELTRATERLGEQWINRAGMAEPEWVVEAEATLRDVDGLEGLVWLDATRAPRFQVFRTTAAGGGSGQVEALTPVLQRLDPPGSGRPRTVVVPAGGEGEGVVVVPLCYLTQCDGYLAGTFSARSVLEAVSGNLPAGIEVFLRAGDRVIGRFPEPPALSAVVPGLLPDETTSATVAPLGWLLSQVPSESTLTALRSRLPVAVLAGGLATALLLTLALWFAAVSDEHRREADAHRILVQESERRFRATFDSAFQMVWLLTPMGDLLEANATSLAVVGTAAEDLRGRPLWETPWFAPPADAGRMRGAVGDAAEGRVVRYEDTLSGGDGDGTIHVLDLSIKPIRDAEGQVGQVLCEGRDITQRRRAEAAITELQTLSSMGRMAARVAHEINNPLAGIRNSFLLVKDAVPPDHPHFRFVGAIEREIGRIAVVTRQLYETYRPDQELHAACAVGTVLSDVAALLHQVNRERDVAISVDTTGISGTVPVAEAVVRQVAYNIIQNAVEASRLGGTVRVSAGVEGEDVGKGALVLIVEDDGPGIPRAVREQIFEPFYSTKTGLSTGGMGLGLALVRRSVEALHGSIIIGDGENGGARFEIRIPLADTTPVSGDNS